MRIIKKVYKNGYRYKYFLGILVSKKVHNNNVNVKKTNLMASGATIENMTLYSPQIPNVGKYSYSAPDLQVFSADTVIGAFCSIGQKVVIGCGSHPQNFLSSSPYFYFNNLGYKNEDSPTHNEYWDYAPVNIGNDVWIGDGVFIKNGIKIGDGAIIGAHSVVTKDIPSYAVVAGVPAKIIKYRFSEENIAELLALQWWNLEDDIIKQIPYDNIEKALEFLRKVKK